MVVLAAVGSVLALAEDMLLWPLADVGKAVLGEGKAAVVLRKGKVVGLLYQGKVR